MKRQQFCKVLGPKLQVLCIFLLLIAGCTPEDERSQEGSLFVKLSSDFTITAVTKAQTKGQADGPSVDDFKVEVYQGETGTVAFRKWDSFSAMAPEVYLPQNTYRLKAYYGEQHKGAFETPYYEGTEMISIVKKKTTNTSVVCKIANTKVTLEYADGFKNYFKGWSAKVASTGDSLTFAKDETRGAYFEPGQVGMNLTMTRQDGKTITYAPPTVATEGGKHYRFRLDVTTSGAGGVNLVIKFDKTTEEKPIYVDISGDNPVIVSPPYISATGFSNGMPITVTEGASAGKIYTLVNARGKIKSCVLRTESRSLTDEGWPASVDLADATANVAALKDKIIFTPGMKGAQMAEIDFTNLIPFLKASSQTTLQHTFTLEVTDDAGKKNEAFALVAQMAVPGFKLLNLEGVDTSDGTALIRFEMTSGDVDKIEAEAKSDYGIWAVQSWTKKPKLTNTKNVYEGEISIDFKEKQQIRLNYNKGNRISNAEYLYRGSFKLEMFDGKGANSDTNPYIWATKARIKIKDNTVSASNLEFRFADVYGQAEKDPIESEVLPDGSVWLKGLEAGVNNKIIACVNNNELFSQPFYIKTEKNIQLPNAGFEDSKVSHFFENIQIGGMVGYILRGKTNSKLEIKPILEDRDFVTWANINNKTMPNDHTNKNTWYIVPSCLATNGRNGSAVLIRNVGWDNTGENVKQNDFYNYVVAIGVKKGIPKPPAVKYKSVGQFFLGTYFCEHNPLGGILSESYNEGLLINSRPTSLTGYFKYIAKKEERGKVIIEIKNNNECIGYGELLFDNHKDSYKDFRVDIKYSDLYLKATKICIKFLATGNMSEADITVSPDTSYGNESYDAAVTNDNAMTCTGSELYIDDLKLIYE